MWNGAIRDDHLRREPAPRSRRFVNHAEPSSIRIPQPSPLEVTHR